MNKEIKYINKRFYRTFKRFPDLNNPETFNEKIQWIKLNERFPLRQLVADKIKVKQYIYNKTNQKIYIPTYWYGNNIEEFISIFNSDLIPNQVMIKANHGCKMNLLVNNKINIDVNMYYNVFQQWLTSNYYEKGYEWCYKNIESQLLIEPLLLDKKQQMVVNDYRFWVFNGKVKLIQVDIDRVGFDCADNFILKKDMLPKRCFYDINWNFLEIEQGGLKSHGFKVNKPQQLSNMISIAEKIGQDFTFIRVDFFVLDDNKFLIGELTNYPVNGFAKFVPEEYDILLGNELKLNLR